MTPSPDRSFACLVVVPVYNVAAHLPELIQRIRQYTCDENILFVNDGSTDGSLDIIVRERLQYITSPKNRGKGPALRAAFAHAIVSGYRSVLTIDAELQHRPEELPGFFARDDGRRIVLGTRDLHFGRLPLARFLSNTIISLLLSIVSGRLIRDSQSGYRLIPTSVLRRMSLSVGGYDIETEITLQAGLLGIAIVEVPVRATNAGEQSHIRPFRDAVSVIRQLWHRIWM